MYVARGRQKKRPLAETSEVMDKFAPLDACKNLPVDSYVVTFWL